MHVVFRTDSSKRIGTGHVMRCRVLARVLKRRGAAVSFLCLKQKGDINHLLREEFDVQELDTVVDLDLPERNQDPLTVDNSDLEIRDAMETKRLLGKFADSNELIIVLDHYGLGKIWEQEVRRGRLESAKLMVIEDLLDREHDADLLLDQNCIDPEKEPTYSKRVPAGCQLMLGPRYSLLSREYQELRERSYTRSAVDSVLVFFGGSDSFGLTAATVSALTDDDLVDLHLDIVLGPNSGSDVEIRELAAKRGNVQVHKNLPSLASLMAKSDLSIGAGGSTTWERFCLGLPSVTTILAENQSHFSKQLAKRGLVYLIKPEEILSQIPLQRAVRSLRNSPKQLSEMSEMGKALVDGCGAELVADALLKERVIE